MPQLKTESIAHSLNEIPMGASLSDDDTCTFKVWAPHADSVSLIGTFNGWNRAEPIKMQGADGYWLVSLEHISPGEEYLYIITNNGETYERIDPQAREVTNSDGNAIVYKDAFDWGYEEFSLPSHNKLAVYELHLGTFAMREHGSPGTFDDLINQLDYLSGLGINAIELMPVAEFSGDLSWGYNPAHIFAIESAYGGPDALKRFVKAAHEHGIGVIIDAVYNHFGPSDLSLWQFDGWSENGKGGIYFYNDHRSTTPWGDTRPDYGRPEVQNFILDNVKMWLEEYHVDGLRLDMTVYMRTINGNAADQGDAIDDGWNLCKRINDLAHHLKPNVLMISEDLQGEDALTRSTIEGGAGFNAQWDKHFVHPVREVILKDWDDERSLQSVATSLMHEYNGDSFSRVIYTESHDEVANGKSRVPESVGDGDIGFHVKKRALLGTCLTFTAAGIPMLFQGQEFLQGGYFEDESPLDWGRADYFSGLLQLHRDLISLRLNLYQKGEALTGNHSTIISLDENRKVLAIVRHIEGSAAFLVVFNFRNQTHLGVEIARPPELGDNEVELLFNSDARCYDEQFTDTGSVNAYDGKLAIDIGPYSCLIAKL